MALAVDVKTSAPKSDQIFVKIRPGLLALKQFESVYILARWIKNFFMDILDRPPPTDTEEAHRQPTNSNGGDAEGGGLGTEMRNSSEDQVLDIQRNTPPADQTTHDTTGVEDNNFAFGQSSGFEGGGFWPTYLASGVFSGVQSSDDMEFPHPDSFQYQAMYFLADLGIASTEPLDQ